ncbi:iron-containing alcohol dehydrogenase [Agromyces mediolanus]|uniref:iron-containing alcohol dehydrogenase n=1 Tax=Agromyces mediolanus TaxID=41986 RepID=UPI001E5014E3|nr:iron-containing alcohol dehydrogenase [Agromyces mediolanus]MCD1573244.1 iron-containing alcohol dehydrogenase [Agromyces mediolanus]
MTAAAPGLPAPARTENALALGILRQPGTVLFGPGQRRQVPRLIAGFARHALLVTDARMAASAEFAALADGLRDAGVAVEVYDGTLAELPRENVMELVERFRDRAIDVVIGIGGGSCLDLAKVSAVVLARGGDVRELYGEFLVPGPGIPVVTVPTTGGTGAEVTCISVIYDAERGMKVGVASPHLEAAVAVIDPELTLSCPPGLTAATGADALSHLVEAFTGRAKNPGPEQLASTLYAGKNLLTDVYARAGLERLATSLPAVVADPADLAARTDTMFASYCAGMAINTAGTAGAHAIQSPIGNLTHTPHGFGVSALLPYVMRYNLPARVPEFAEIGSLLGVADPDAPELERAKAGIVGVESLLEVLGAPTDLAALGLDPADFGFVADQALLATRLTANNPRELDRAAVLEILERGHAGDRGWWSQ